MNSIEDAYIKSYLEKKASLAGLSLMSRKIKTPKSLSPVKTKYRDKINKMIKGTAGVGAAVSIAAISISNDRAKDRRKMRSSEIITY